MSLAGGWALIPADTGGIVVTESPGPPGSADTQLLTAEVQRLTEEARRASRELQSFTYSVSHDLAAPLRAIGGFSTALLEDCGGSLSAECRAYAERLRAASDQVSAMLSGLLQFSRLARAEVHSQRVDLGAEADSIASELQAGDPDRSARFTIEKPLWAEADPPLVHLVLEKLLDNAWKFTSHEGETQVEFGAAATGDGGACYFVRDNGVGFDAERADKLFDPFWRLPTASGFPGVGMGLASVKRIVERHGGRVWAEASTGEGATFYFTLGDGKTTV